MRIFLIPSFKGRLSALNKVIFVSNSQHDKRLYYGNALFKKPIWTNTNLDTPTTKMEARLTAKQTYVGLFHWFCHFCNPTLEPAIPKRK